VLRNSKPNTGSKSDDRNHIRHGLPCAMNPRRVAMLEHAHYDGARGEEQSEGAAHEDAVDDLDAAVLGPLFGADAVGDL